MTIQGIFMRRVFMNIVTFTLILLILSSLTLPFGPRIVVESVAQAIQTQGDEPWAKLLASPPVGYAPLNVTFYAASNLQEAVYMWDYESDGFFDTVNDGRDTSHVYEKPGVYTARLVVRSGVVFKREAQAEVTITVLDPEAQAMGGKDQPAPWSEDGLAPYRSYFKNHNEYVDPATGKLTIRRVDLHLPGRGLDLEIAWIYTPPTKHVTHYPSYTSYTWSGETWRLDLPSVKKGVYNNGRQGNRYCDFMGRNKCKTEPHSEVQMDSGSMQQPAHWQPRH